MHKQLSGMGTEAATSCPCVPSPRGQRQWWKSTPGCRELDISPGTRGRSLCGEQCYVHPTGMCVFSQGFACVCIVFSGAGSRSSPGSALGRVGCSTAQASGWQCLGRLPWSPRPQPCSGSCRWPQHGVTDKSLHAARGTLQVHEGQCSPYLTTGVFSDHSITQELPHRALNPPDPVGMGSTVCPVQEGNASSCIGGRSLPGLATANLAGHSRGPRCPFSFFLSS